MTEQKDLENKQKNVNKQTDKSKSNQEKTINILHFYYLGSILVIIIIGLVALMFAESSFAGSMLSFAATLSSVILAVIAIIITLIDVAGQRNNILDVKTSVEDLKNVRTEIVSLIDELELKNKESSETIVTTLEFFRESHREDIERVISKIKEIKVDTKDPQEKEKVKEAQQDLEKVLHSYKTKVDVISPERRKELLNKAVKSLNDGNYVVDFKTMHNG